MKINGAEEFAGRLVTGFAGDEKAKKLHSVKPANRILEEYNWRSLECRSPKNWKE
jgi:hypothetical protein